MRSLRRRKQDIWICEASTDDTEMETRTIYTKPKRYRVSVSNTSGTPHELPAGIVPEYSRYIVSYNRRFKPSEGDVLFIDRKPRLTRLGELELDDNGEPYTTPDYVLSHVMDTQRGTIARYGIKKIAGGEDE